MNLFAFASVGYGSSIVLTGTRGCGEIKACDLTTSVRQDADQLTLIGDGWTQPTDGVGVQMAGDRHLCPRRAGVFLPGTLTRGGVKKLEACFILMQRNDATQHIYVPCSESVVE